MKSGIKHVVPLDHHRLEISLENGGAMLLNLDRKVLTARFGILREPDIWCALTYSRTSISWGGYVELSLTEAAEILFE